MDSVRIRSEWIRAILGRVDGITSSYKEETVNSLSEFIQKYITFKKRLIFSSQK